MEIILREDVPGLGFVGEKVKVRRGYARNWLIPKGAALEVTSRNQRMVAHEMSAIQAKRIRLKGEAESVAQNLSSLKLEFSLRAGEKGRTFGSITTKEIAEVLNAKGFPVDRRRLKLEQAVRGFGEYRVLARLHSEVVVEVPFVVKEEVVAKETEEAQGDGAKKPRRSSRKKKTTEESEAPSSEEAAPTEE